jgi:transposase-like protein
MAELKFEVPEGAVEGLFSQPGGEGFRVLVETVVQALIERQADEHFNAPWNARGIERPNGYRNGFKSRSFQTVAGALDLSVPQARNGSFKPAIFERWQRSERAMMAACVDMVLMGVSNRKVTRLAEEAFGAAVSPGLVSQLVKDLDPAVEAFNTRPLGRYRYLLVDARFDKVREGKRVVSRAFLWAMGVNEEGEREVLGFLDWGGETEVAWESLFATLKRRGLKGVELLVSDAHEGLCEAAMKAFPGASWQECQAHFLRRAIEEVRKDDQKAFRNDVRMILQAADRAECDDLLKRLQERWDAKVPKAVAYVEEHLEGLVAILALPESHHKRLRTTNSVERVNQELKRKGRLVRIWGNAEARARIYGALLMEQHEAWMGTVWLNMKDKV